LEPNLEPGQVPHPEVPSWARDFAALAELNKAQQPWDVPRGHDMSGEKNTVLFRGLYYTAKPFSIMESKSLFFLVAQIGPILIGGDQSWYHTMTTERTNNVDVYKLVGLSWLSWWGFEVG